VGTTSTSIVLELPNALPGNCEAAVRMYDGRDEEADIELSVPGRELLRCLGGGLVVVVALS